MEGDKYVLTMFSECYRSCWVKETFLVLHQ